MKDALLKGFEVLRLSNGLWRAPGRGDQGGKIVRENAVLQGFEAVRLSNGLGRAPGGGDQREGGREELGRCSFKRL